MTDKIPCRNGDNCSYLKQGRCIYAHNTYKVKQLSASVIGISDLLGEELSPQEQKEREEKFIELLKGKK